MPRQRRPRGWSFLRSVGVSSLGGRSILQPPMQNDNAPDRPLADIARYVASYSVGDEAINAARLCLFDALACALEALDQPECTKLLGPLVPGTVVPNGARLPG